MPKSSQILVPLLFLLVAMIVNAFGETVMINTVKTNCAAKWPDDYKMQKHCREEQFDALDSIAQYSEQYPSDTEESKILNRCLGKWGTTPGKEDYKMAMHCTKEQLEAYQELYPSKEKSSAIKDKIPLPPLEVSALTGKRVFNGKGVCHVCHGRDGDPHQIPESAVEKIRRLNPKPTDLRTASTLHDKTDEDLFKTIKLGIPGTAMVAMSHITNEETWHLISYIREINQE